MQFKILLSLIFIFLSFSSLSATNKELLYGEIIDISDDLSKLCPKEDCLLIGIGRSPTPFIDYLEIANKANIARLPLSSFRYNPELAHMDLKTKMELTSTDLDDLMKHFSTFILPKITDSIKKVRLLDFANTGHSIFATYRYLNLFLEKNNLNLETQISCISSFSTATTVIKQHEKFKIPVEKIDLKVIKDEGLLMDALYYQYFDSVAKYESFDITADSKVLKNKDEKRAEYLVSLKKEISKKKEKSCFQLLDQFLNK